jgi:hypothetical protein
MAGSNEDTSNPVERDGDVTRRRMLKLTIGAAIAAPIVDLAGVGSALAQTATAFRPLFFTAEEFALVDELAEMIIPTDERSPGARAAKVAAYIDARLAETLETEEQTSWRAGLAATNELSKKETGKAFMESTPEERLATLTKMAKTERGGKTPEEQFFGMLKGATAYAYYTSEIGIHKDIGYLGNTYQNEYSGYDVSQEPPQVAAPKAPD